MIVAHDSVRERRGVCSAHQVGGERDAVIGNARGRGGADCSDERCGRAEPVEVAASSERNAECDDEFGIAAADEAPPNWSHPPSVNSLDPTSTESFVAALSTVYRKGVQSPQPQRQVSARNHHHGGQQITKLRRMPKREVSLLSMQNGELYALLRSDEVWVTGVKPRSRHLTAGRAAAEQAAALAAAAPVQFVIGSAHWVACDRCGKWRRVSELTFEQSQASDAEWFCEQNLDNPSLASCDAPEEAEDEGELVQVPPPANTGAPSKDNEGPASSQLPWIFSAEEAYCACLKVR